MLEIIETVFHNAFRLTADYHILLPLAVVIFYAVLAIMKIEMDYKIYQMKKSKSDLPDSIIFMPIIEFLIIIAYTISIIYASYHNNNIFIILMMSGIELFMIFVIQISNWMSINPDIVHFMNDYKDNTADTDNNKNK